MKKNKPTIITRPRLYSGGGSMDLSALQGMTGGSSGGGAGFSGGLFGAIDSSVQKTLDIAKMFIPKQENPHLVSRRALRGYDLGGALQVANTAASQVAQVASNINDVNDRAKAVEEDIKGQVTNPSPSASTDDLLSKWSSWNPTAHISWKDLTNKGSALSYATDMFSMSSQGAAAGSSLGPIGAIAGGVGGLVSGFFSNWGAKREAEKKAGKINSMIDAQNLSTQRAFSNQAEQLDDEMVAKELSDFTGWEAAYGGPLFKVPKQYQDGGTLAKEEINPGLDAIVKARLALDSHFGNPTARRMTNYDTRSYTFPDGRRGNVYVGSYGNYVTPQIQDVDGELKFIEDPWSEENWKRSEAQSMKFESPRDAEYFAKNYKRFAPMMSLYSEGGIIQNARKWKHAFGGDLMTHGADFPTGLILVGNGGTHEENPNEGVPMGMDSEGIPNLVEEGEVIFNDYVFSKRLKVPKAMRKKYRLRGTKPLTFADAAIQMSKESEERPNDPISQAGLEDGMLKLMMAQEQIRAKEGKTNTFAKGGLVRRYDTAGPLPIMMRDPNNPFGLSEDMLGQLPAVTESSSTLDPNRSALSVIAERKSASAPIREDLDGNLYRRQYNYSSSDPLNISAKRTEVELPDTEGLEIIKDKPIKPKETTTGSKGMDYLRFAPAISQGIQTLTDALGLTNRPDFALGRKIREANRQVRGIGTRAAGQRMGYRPIDMWAAINNFNSQMAAQRSAIRNSGNRVSSAGQLLASAYNQNRALGELYAGMEKANWDRLTQAIAHNTSIDQANRAAELQAAQADAAQGNIRSQNLITAAKADDAEETAYAQARAINRDTFFNTLGALGKEKIDRSMLKGLIESGLLGTPNEAMLEALNYLGINPKINPKTTKKAKGGKINRKKRGLTY